MAVNSFMSTSRSFIIASLRLGWPSGIYGEELRPVSEKSNRLFTASISAKWRQRLNLPGSVHSSFGLQCEELDLRKDVSNATAVACDSIVA